MGKTNVPDFSPDVCHGVDSDVSDTCPKRVYGQESTGRPIIDTLARLETRVLEVLTGEDQHKCGICGCPLPNLEAADKAPDGCPRLEHHQ